eukprot:CAMPEP_0171729728 /NCGR_PEP_ID=MMETSP0991-20121206/27817_1 /TAXON_ID=483369 /ORGANISM="non described non described, Strain CCMP2098" /LENGTH=57 /DNA_ID=CAMNT_0012324223 /DNA_START=367 /DNA_END=540 /DNA_ORIENTATION=+
MNMPRINTDLPEHRQGVKQSSNEGVGTCDHNLDLRLLLIPPCAPVASLFWPGSVLSV